ncbi:MAG: L,D-transpeptidase [Maritimibacter harenae]
MTPIRLPIAAFIVVAAPLAAGPVTAAPEVTSTSNQPTAPIEPLPEIPDGVEAIVDLSDQTLTVLRTEDGRTTHRVWPVSTGADGYGTPTGRFQPTFLDRDHTSSLYDDAPMPWSVFFNEDIAIHGTYDTRYIGRPASHGCVRMMPKAAKAFFRMVDDAGRGNTTIKVES